MRNCYILSVAMIHASYDTKPPSRGDNIRATIHASYGPKPPPLGDIIRALIHARYDAPKWPHTGLNLKDSQ